MLRLHLGVVDGIIQCSFEGAGGRRDLFMHNHDWRGLLKATPQRAMSDKDLNATAKRS
jgi:hypothetical protein